MDYFVIGRVDFHHSMTFDYDVVIGHKISINHIEYLIIAVVSNSVYFLKDVI